MSTKKENNKKKKLKTSTDAIPPNRTPTLKLPQKTRNKSFSFGGPIPKTPKQKLYSYMKNKEKLAILVQDKNARTMILKGLSKGRKAVLVYISKEETLHEVIDFLLCRDVTPFSAERCHWAANVILTRNDNVMNGITDKPVLLDHLFKFIEEDLYLVNKKDSIVIPLHLVPNNMQYFVMTMKCLIFCRGEMILRYILEKDQQFITKFLTYFKYPPICYLLLELLAVEHKLHYEDNIAISKKFNIIENICKIAQQNPSQYNASLNILVESVSRAFPSDSTNYRKIVNSFIPSMITYLIKQMKDPNTTSDVLEIYFNLWSMTDADDDIQHSFIKETIKNIETLRKSLCSKSALVSLHAFTIVYQLLVRGNVIEPVKICLETIIQIFFRYPLRNVFHGAVVNLLDYILRFKAKLLKPLKEYIYELDILKRIEIALKNPENSPALCHLQQIVLSIPIKWKGEEWKKIEKKLFKEEKVNSCFIVPEKLRKKKEAAVKKMLKFDLED